MIEPCKKPPEGWRCTRYAGHDGPCAAHPLHSIDRDIKGNPELAASLGVEPEWGKDADRIERELRERVSRRPPPNLVLESKTTAPALPTATELLGRQAWSLKCLLQDIRSTSKVLYGEQRANATLAVRHLEDALHRINLALEQ
jgi:hypothetical protein